MSVNKVMVDKNWLIKLSHAANLVEPGLEYFHFLTWARDKGYVTMIQTAASGSMFFIDEDKYNVFELWRLNPKYGDLSFFEFIEKMGIER